MRSNYKRLGDFIELVDIRNDELSVETLLGLSISKQFIPSVANTVGTNMKNYKIIKRNQFACSIMQVRRDKKMPIALLKDFDEAIISQAYPAFQVLNENTLSPDYLMMWFTRAEFDRQATFWAVGGVRGSLEWDDFLDFELPILPIEEQRAIEAEYQTVTDRIHLNEQINTKLEETAQALYRHWFVDFEFPDENGNPYKSSGGKMVYNEELEKEVPEGWEAGNFLDVLMIQGGGTPSTIVPDYWNGNIPFFTPADIGRNYYSVYTEKHLTQSGLENCSSKLLSMNTIIITARGTVGATTLLSEPMAMNQSCYAFNEINYNNFYGHQFALRQMFELKETAVGAVFNALVTKDFAGKEVLISTVEIRGDFDKLVASIYNQVLEHQLQNIELKSLQTLLLSKMAGIKAFTQPKAEAV